jgi:hypothetical protein
MAIHHGFTLDVLACRIAASGQQGIREFTNGNLGEKWKNGKIEKSN